MNRIIKRACAAAVCGAVAVSSFASLSACAVSKFSSPIDALDMAKDMGVGINIGNTMEAYDANGCERSTYTWIPKVGNNTPGDYESCWGAPITTQAMVDGMKKAGFRTVRIPVFWGNMMENDDTWTINKDYLARVAEIVKYCTNDDLYAVVNIHHFDEFIIRRHNTQECAEIIGNLWTQIAEYFKDCDYNVVFEGFNEYLGGQYFNASGRLVDRTDAEAYELTNTLNQTFVDAVRATGGKNADRVLIASGYWTNIDKTTSSQFKMPTDSAKNKQMVSVHYVDNNMYWERQIGSKKWQNYAVAQCELLKKAFTSKNIPVFVGETTSNYPSGNFASKPVIKGSSNCLSYMLRLITDYGFVPVLWDTPNNFYDRNNCKIASTSNASVILGISGMLSGEYDLGDLNSDGKINYKDVNFAIAISKGKIKASQTHLDCGDLDRNGRIDASDIMILIQAANGNKRLY